mmetsp:Transcript_787/g.1076  ORF Transcript_787/g.1076 Transcript_787/m.1076 type:complete len:560 (+) Transcript_787:50-1729(+)
MTLFAQPNLERMKARLKELIEIRSITGDEMEAVEKVHSWLLEMQERYECANADGSTANETARRFQIDFWVDEMSKLEKDEKFGGKEVEREKVPCVAARLRGTKPGKCLILNGHIDVVPAGDLDAWMYDPFQAHVDANHMYGRGSCDMKGGLVGAIEVFELFASQLALDESASAFSGEIVLIVVSGEEDGGAGTLSAIRRGYKGDFAIIPEPTGTGSIDPNLVIAHAGALTATLSVEGRSAHACKRLEGESALDHYFNIHQHLKSAEHAINDQEKNPLLRELVCPYPTSVGIINGGQWASSVMDQLSAQVRFGVCVGETTEQAEQRFRKTIQEVASADKWLSNHPPTVEITGGRFSASSIDPKHPLVQTILNSSRATIGRQPKLAAAPYGCDMALWVNVGKTPACVFGPGDVRLAHAPNEKISLDALSRTTLVIFHAAVSLLQHDALLKAIDVSLNSSQSNNAAASSSSSVAAADSAQKLAEENAKLEQQIQLLQKSQQQQQQQPESSVSNDVKQHDDVANDDVKQHDDNDKTTNDQETNSSQIEKQAESRSWWWDLWKI